MKKQILILFAAVILLLAIASSVYAVCPLCTIAVGAGVGVLRELGVDDIITGLWFGALIISSFLWMINWMDKKKMVFLFRKPLILVLFYLIALLPLYWMKYIIYQNYFLGLDKIMFGTLLGTIIFTLSVWADGYLKKQNEGKVLISYQRVIVPVIFLTISSIIIALLLAILI